LKKINALPFVLRPARRPAVIHLTADERWHAERRLTRAPTELSGLIDAGAVRRCADADFSRDVGDAYLREASARLLPHIREKDGLTSSLHRRRAAVRAERAEYCHWRRAAGGSRNGSVRQCGCSPLRRASSCCTKFTAWPRRRRTRRLPGQTMLRFAVPAAC